MKKILSLFLVSISCSLNAQQLFSSKMEKEDITKVCNAVSEWQITHHNEVKHNPLDWTNGALYRGMTEWGKVSGNQSCYDFVRTIGEKHKWNMWDRVYHADDICVGQAFIEMYRRFDDKRMLQPVMERAYYVASHPSKATLQKTDAIGTTERWSWSDALFMAPPVYAALYTITGDKIYLNYMDSEYKECVDSLYDKEDHLFYRDNKRIPLREKNGSKQFWGRGNGWVFAGLPLIIDNLPLNCPSRNYYIRLFTEMAEAVRKTQCKDGDWRTSLLDPDSYKMPENSCSAFMCFGIAWGIRNGYLPQRTYKPVLEKGWQSLVKAVHSDGKLGYIQPVGAAPKAAGHRHLRIDGMGGKLCAGQVDVRFYFCVPKAHDGKTWLIVVFALIADQFQQLCRAALFVAVPVLKVLLCEVAVLVQRFAAEQTDLLAFVGSQLHFYIACHILPEIQNRFSIGCAEQPAREGFLFPDGHGVHANEGERVGRSPHAVPAGQFSFQPGIVHFALLHIILANRAALGGLHVVIRNADRLAVHFQLEQDSHFFPEQVTVSIHAGGAAIPAVAQCDEQLVFTVTQISRYIVCLCCKVLVAGKAAGG